MKIVAITGMDLTYLIEHLPKDLQSQVELKWFRKAEDAKPELADAEVIVTAGKMNPAVPASAPKLRWVQTLSAGIDQLPLEEFTARGTLVTNMKGVHTIQMSEFALSLMLQWARRSNLLYANQLQRVWDQRISFGELYGKTVGIIGAGAIGDAVARKAKAFDMHIIGLNRSGVPVPSFDETVHGEAGLAYLLEKSDFIILLLPSTAKTRHFIRAEHLSHMKEHAFLINLARGDVIEEEALIAALANHQIAGAALDVFQQEPLPPDSPFWQMDNVILTPHIAGASAHYVERASPIFYHNIRQYLAGLPLRNTVNLTEGY